jgi:hypothetical protein
MTLSEIKIRPRGSCVQEAAPDPSHMEPRYPTGLLSVTLGGDVVQLLRGTSAIRISVSRMVTWNASDCRSSSALLTT